MRFFYIVLDIYVLTRTYIYINKSLYLLKVRRLRQKISFTQIQSMAGTVISEETKKPWCQVVFDSAKA
jgi:hypothetical protein